MKAKTRTTMTLALAVPMVAGLLSGCVYRKETTQVPVASTPPPQVTVAVASPDRVVTYPEGRYQLYGNGTTTPYYWVWIPAGATAPTPPPPPPVPTR